MRGQWAPTDTVGQCAHGRHHAGDRHKVRRSGPGIGTVVAAGTAGPAGAVVGGMVAAEPADEIGDFFEGDEEEG